MVRLARARRADDGHHLARRHLEADALAGSGARHRKRRDTSLEAHRGVSIWSGLAPGRSSTSGASSRSVNMVSMIDQALPDLAVNHAR